jgi:hypothetical protein
VGSEALRSFAFIRSKPNRAARRPFSKDAKLETCQFSVGGARRHRSPFVVAEKIATLMKAMMKAVRLGNLLGHKQRKTILDLPARLRIFSPERRAIELLKFSFDTGLDCARRVGPGKHLGRLSRDAPPANSTISDESGTRGRGAFHALCSRTLARARRSKPFLDGRTGRSQ